VNAATARGRRKDINEWLHRKSVKIPAVGRIIRSAKGAEGINLGEEKRSVKMKSAQGSKKSGANKGLGGQG